MKTISIFFCSMLILLSGCSTLKKIRNKNKFHIVNAGYANWSQSPMHGGDVPEEGIDLALIIKNWPNNASPEYIIYHNRKSFHAELTDTSDVGRLINAQIITSSSIIRTKSEKVNLSDRLVYKKADGTIDSLAIKEWHQIKE